MTPGLESQLWSGTFVLPFVQFHAVYMSYLFSPCTQMKRRQRQVVDAPPLFNSIHQLREWGIHRGGLDVESQRAATASVLTQHLPALIRHAVVFAPAVPPELADGELRIDRLRRLTKALLPARRHPLDHQPTGGRVGELG